MSVDLLGSFSLILFVCWAGFSLLSWIAYPKVRERLLAMQPAAASNLLLAWIMAPLLISLVLTTLLFVPVAEAILVGHHCHDDCGIHAPVANSLLLIWPGVVLLLAAMFFFGWTIWRQYQSVRQLAANLQALGEDRANFILLHQDEPLVFTLGWWRNKIYISKALLDRCSESELKVILAHEDGHAQRKDNLRSTVAKFGLLPLPPKLARRVYGDYQLLTESACDFIAAKRCGSLVVAESLLKVHRLVSTSSPLPQGVSAFAGSSIEYRVRALLEDFAYRPSKISLMVLAVAVAALTLGSIHPLHHLSELLMLY